VKKLLIIAALSAVLTAGSGPAQAADECDGLMVCVPVSGPWVVVPTSRTVPRPTVEYQLTCPRGYIVGGLDAELSDRGIDISFIGSVGSPVNPGITTGRSVVFVAAYVGTTAQTPTFRPYVGCMPASGGGRIPTSVRKILKPGQPTTRRVRRARVVPGANTVVSTCRAGETLVGASHAVGLGTRTPPSAAVIENVTAAQVVRGRRVVVSARGNAELGRIRAIVQAHAVCSGVK
jgi:hypothetical protein